MNGLRAHLAAASHGVTVASNAHPSPLEVPALRSMPYLTPIDICSTELLGQIWRHWV